MPKKDEDNFFTDYDPYNESAVFWDKEEFDQEVDDDERFERASIAQELVECWDRLRDPGARGKYLLNLTCGHMVRAFGMVMKLKFSDAIKLMDQVAAASGREKVDLLMRSAREIQRTKREPSSANTES